MNTCYGWQHGQRCMPWQALAEACTVDSARAAHDAMLEDACAAALVGGGRGARLAAAAVRRQLALMLQFASLQQGQVRAFILQAPLR